MSTMWSVKLVPNPGLARIASRSSALRAFSLFVTANFSSVGASRFFMAVLYWSCVEVTLQVSTGSTSADSRSSTRERGDDGVADLRGAALAVTAGGEVGFHRCIDASGRLRQAEVIQHEAHREDGCRRVCQLLAGNVGRGAVYRLEHAGECAVRVDVSGCRQPDAATDCAGEVGEDVTEEV